MKNFLFILISMVMLQFSFAQNANEIINQSSKLKKSIRNNDNESTANSYFELANNYFKANEYQKSESFYIKALQIYEKLEDKNNIAKISRALAICQEKLNKIPQANFNYSNANKFETNSINQRLNSNDSKRLISNSLETQEENLKDNIEVLKTTNNSQELADGYLKLAEVNSKNNEITEAKSNLDKAYLVNKNENPKKAIEIQNKISNLYVKEKEFDKAIVAKKELLKEDFVKNNSETKSQQLQELATLYQAKDNTNDAVSLLEKSFEIAIKNGHTMEAKNSIVKLDSIFKKQNQSEKSLVFYRSFLQKLAEIIKKDKSLINKNLLAETEEKLIY